MAVLRFLHLPTATGFSGRHSQLTPPRSPPRSSYKPPHINTAFSSPFLSLILPAKPQRFSLYHIHASSSVEAEAATENQENVETKEVEEEEEFSKTRILAENVPWTCTADDIRPLFEKYGKVVDIELSMYNKTRNRGLAFVTMASEEEALAAFTNLESYEFMDRALKLNWAKPKKIKNPPRTPRPAPIHNVYVANVSWKARAKDLKEFFNASNGKVVSSEIIFQDEPRRSAGYGFVSFDTKEDADAALAAFQGKEFMGRPIRLAPSKSFLRRNTKAELELNNDLTKSESSEKPDEPDAVSR